MDIIQPDKTWTLDLPKNKDGNYIVVPQKKGYSGINISNKKKYPDGYLYLIKGHNTDFYKVGVTINIKRRISDIDSYMPFDLEILSLHYFKNVYNIEAKISEMLKTYNIRREWYNLTLDKAKEIMIFLHNLNIKEDAPNTNI